MVSDSELRALASKWKQMAMEQVPAAYADRKLHSKYLKLDNYASGMDDCAIELIELLDSERRPSPRPADPTDAQEACDAETHVFLRDKAGHKYCHQCGERLLSQPSVGG